MYVGLFTAVMLGAIVVNVLLGLGELTSTSCVSADCRGARSLGPVVVGLGTVALMAALARLLGPVFVSPAIGAWLVTSPVDRAELLRPRMLAGGAVAAVVTGLVTAAAATLAGWTLPVGALLVVATALTGVAVLGLAVRLQAVATSGPTTPATPAGPTTPAVPGGPGGLGGPAGIAPARVALRVPGVVAWLLLFALAVGLGSRVPGPDPGPWWYAAAAAGGGLALAGAVTAWRAVPRLHRRDVVRGASLVPAVSGALATLDLSLAWDVVSEHQWRGRPAVRSRRGRWSGVGALVWADLARLRRSPGRLLRLVAAAALPYAVQAAGAGRTVILVVSLTGFLVALPLLTGLRVLERSHGLVRLLPFTIRGARVATALVPLVCLVGFGLATSPSLPSGQQQQPLLGLAAGVVAAAAAVRWMTGRPPDYSAPLVSTPAGGVPTNLYGSIVRGFDVALLGTAPMLLSPTTTGALWSLAVAGGVLVYLLGRDASPTP